MDADPDSTSPPTRLTYTDICESDPAWSPHGNQIAYVRGGNYYGWGASLSVMNASGENQRDIRQGTETLQVRDPDWSSRYGRIVYGHVIPTSPGGNSIASMDADGSWDTLLSPFQGGLELALSPDGTNIAFASHRGNSADYINDTEIYVADPTTPPMTEATCLTDNPAHDREPDWGEVLGSSTSNLITQVPDTTITSGPSSRVSYEAKATKVTLNPNVDLARGTTYNATVTIVAKDLVGNPLAQKKVWSFTTAR